MHHQVTLSGWNNTECNLTHLDGAFYHTPGLNGTAHSSWSAHLPSVWPYWTPKATITHSTCASKYRKVFSQQQISMAQRNRKLVLLKTCCLDIENSIWTVCLSSFAVPLPCSSHSSVRGLFATFSNGVNLGYFKNEKRESERQYYVRKICYQTLPILGKLRQSQCITTLWCTFSISLIVARQFHNI